LSHRAAVQTRHCWLRPASIAVTPISCLLLCTGIWPIQVSSAAAAEQPANSVAPEQGYTVYKSLPLGGQITGIRQMQCSVGDCTVLHATQQLAGADGSVDVWEDSRITPAMRSKLWGRGGKIAFGGQAAKPAIVALHDASGAVRATLQLDKALADLDPLLTGAIPAPYLLSMDYPVGYPLIVRVILNIDVDRYQIALATYTGPTSVPTSLPTGETVLTPVPGPRLLVIFDTNFEIETNAADHTARIAVIRCTPSSYIDDRTHDPIPMNLLTRTEYKLHGAVWQRQARLAFRNCSDRYDVNPLQTANASESGIYHFPPSRPAAGP